MDIEYIKENLVLPIEAENAAEYKLMGQFRMYHCGCGGQWLGKWEAEDAGFIKNGVTEAEKEALKKLCDWINTSFADGFDAKCIEFLADNCDGKTESGGYYINLPIDNTSYVIAKYITSPLENAIRVYLYRRKDG